MSMTQRKLENDTVFKTPSKATRSHNGSTIESFGMRESPQVVGASNTHTHTDRSQVKRNKVIQRIMFDQGDLQSVAVRREGALVRSKRSAFKESKVLSSFTLGQINSFEIRRDNTIVNKLEKLSDEELEMYQSPKQQRNELIACRCKKTKCNKLYCDCFANNQECSSRCDCIDCCNRSYKMNKTNKSDYGGCNCKKQDCSKKYCECLKRNQVCTDKCHCGQECKNCRSRFSPQPLDLDQFSLNLECREYQEKLSQ